MGKRLRAAREAIATAESCTGGWLAKTLTDLPGSSDYFERGWITYSNEAKQAELAVDGNHVAKLPEGAVVTCVPSTCTARFIRFGERRYHQILKAKFGLMDR